MNKKLPGVFANNISSSAAHNKNVSYSNKIEKNIENNIIKQPTEKLPDTMNVNQKINAIFNSSRYVYKADVNITLKDEVIKRRIIGRNSIHLITIDNELIPISDIVDIEFAD